jgi:hypothetical protein
MDIGKAHTHASPNEKKEEFAGDFSGSLKLLLEISNL